MSGECLSFEQSTNGPRNNTASPARVTLRRAQDDTNLRYDFKTRFLDFKDTGLKAYLAIATSRPILIPIGSSQRQKGGRKDLRSLKNFLRFIHLITTMSFPPSCFGTAQGARRKPKRHARQGVQVFSSPQAAHALPARRNDMLVCGISSDIVVLC